jgi:hypothetical protein
MLLSDDGINSQKQLDSVDTMALRVGLNINIKYLGSWLLNCTKDFEIKKALAWKACI